MLSASCTQAAMGKRDMETRKAKRDKSEMKRQKIKKDKKAKKRERRNKKESAIKKGKRVPKPLNPPPTDEETQKARNLAEEYVHKSNPKITLADSLAEAAQGFSFGDYNFPTKSGPRPSTVLELIVRLLRKGKAAHASLACVCVACS